MSTRSERGYYLLLFKMIKAAITPGIHPKRVSINTIKIDPQPLSMTASGGKRIDNITLQTLISLTKISKFIIICRRPLLQKTIDW
jgi:hypothetical protein